MSESVRGTHAMGSLILGSLSILGLLFGMPAGSEIFRYQDEQGRWHFTDRPPPGVSAPMGDAAPVSEPAQGRDLAERLAARFQTQTPVQQATLATVAIQTVTGGGAGFFVSADGYVLTNRHVVRPSPEFGEKDQQQFEIARQRLESMEQELAARRKRMAGAAQDLASVGQGGGRHLDERALQREYDYYKSAADQLAAQMSEGERSLREARRELDFRRNSAMVQSSFTLVLKDGTRLSARLIGTSAAHDLALLKLDGYRTPVLPVSASGLPGQGETVYAIGSPLGVSDSVTVGRVTRLGAEQLLTDVQLLPGNSGGPLVNESGEVVAVNFAKLTSGGNANYQGFGMAIPIGIARAAFPELR